MLNHKEQSLAAKEFSKRWAGRGYEKGESHSFWRSLLGEVYGVENLDDYIRFEERVMLDNTSFIDGYIPSTHVLIEQKSIDKDLGKAIRQSDGSLLTPFQQAKRYSSELKWSERPRWVIISNFKKFRIYDMEKPTGEPEILYLKNLEKEYYRLNFLVNKEDINIQKAKEISIKAGELVGILYDALLKEYENPEDDRTLKDLNALCVRLVFCFYAEDSGLFGKRNMFYDYLSKHKGIYFRNALIRLFEILDQKPDERDPYLDDDLAAFPYVNGGLFENKNMIIPRINNNIIDIILNKASAHFDWSEISPTIFGAVFESTLNPETRHSGGMHYTSIENIHKVTDPLFMNGLYEEFSKINGLKTIKIRDRRLEEFHSEIASLKFLDPAAGSGNFLTETYISLRKLENRILETLFKGQQKLGGEITNPIKVSIDQFYGIEINDFAVTVAKTALWIAESQMLKKTEDIIHENLEFLPIKSDAKIIQANAIRIDWEKVIPKKELNYIIGNPPFLGHQNRNRKQIEDMKTAFHDLKKHGKLDYVCAWYNKATDYMKNTRIKSAFVSTNSICQGESVGILWRHLFSKGVVINYAYQSFIWNSEAVDKAQVQVIIIGFGMFETNRKLLFTDERYNVVSNINGYLMDAPNVFIESRGKVLTQGLPEMTKGSQPTDGGNLILSPDERNELILKFPESKELIKPYVGAREFINKTFRYCLWLDNVSPLKYKDIKPIINRINKVVAFREKSPTQSVQRDANIPMLFTQIRQPESDYFIIPQVSSENRKYIPIGYMSQDVIASNANYLLPNVNLFMFGVLTSNVHMAWMRTVAGRLEMRYRYSPAVYNNFPWCNPTKNQKEKIEKTAQSILDARNKYSDITYSEMYGENMFIYQELLKAHQENDKAVMEAYGFDWKAMSESECVAELMNMYSNLLGK